MTTYMYVGFVHVCRVRIRAEEKYGLGEGTCRWGWDCVMWGLGGGTFTCLDD